jgi:hypothetical protein
MILAFGMTGRPTAELKAMLWGRPKCEENLMSLNFNGEPSCDTNSIKGDRHMGKHIYTRT